MSRALVSDQNAIEFPRRGSFPLSSIILTDTSGKDRRVRSIFWPTVRVRRALGANLPRKAKIEKVQLSS